MTEWLSTQAHTHTLHTNKKEKVHKRWVYLNIIPWLPQRHRCLKIKSEHQRQCGWIRSGCWELKKSILKREQKLVERKAAFNQNNSNLGRCSIPPKTTSENSIMKALKGKREVISITEIEGQSRHHPPLSAGWSTSCDPPLDVILFTKLCSPHLFRRLLKGKLGKRSGHL